MQNEKKPYTEGNMELKLVWKVGRVGQLRTGMKVHLVRALQVVGVDVSLGTVKPGTYAAKFLHQQKNSNPAPVYYSVAGACNGNGQHTGTVMEELTFDHITCEKCRKRAVELGFIKATDAPVATATKQKAVEQSAEEKSLIHRVNDAISSVTGLCDKLEAAGVEKSLIGSFFHDHVQPTHNMRGKLDQVEQVEEMARKALGAFDVLMSPPPADEAAEEIEPPPAPTVHAAWLTIAQIADEAQGHNFKRVDYLQYLNEERGASWVSITSPDGTFDVSGHLTCLNTDCLFKDLDWWRRDGIDPDEADRARIHVPMPEEFGHYLIHWE